MEQKTIATGFVALLVGFGLGSLTGNSGPDASEIEAIISENIAASTDAVSGLAAGVEDQFAALGERLNGLEEQLGAPADTSAIDNIGTRLDALAGDLQTTLSEQQDAVSTGIAALGDKITAAASNAAAQVTETETPDEMEAAAEPAEATAEATSAEAPEGGTGIGETAILADGQLRVFISGVGDGTARALVNGELVTLDAGTATTVGDCEVMLDGAAAGKATVSGSCGGTGDAAADAAPAEETANNADGSGSDEGTGMGHTAILADGAVRVFVSGIAADGGTARLAVNGVGVQNAAAGDSIPAGDEGCSVTVDAIHASSVSLGYGCDS